VLPYRTMDHVQTVAAVLQDGQKVEDSLIIEAIEYLMDELTTEGYVDFVKKFIGDNIHPARKQKHN
jgi:hypothetical protein